MGVFNTSYQFMTLNIGLLYLIFIHFTGATGFCCIVATSSHLGSVGTGFTSHYRL